MAKAKFRMVHTEFWNDPVVSEEMTPEDKYFFLYLLTNEHTTQIGIYGISKKQMAFETGYSIESITALMQRFLEHHKLIRYNDKTREIAIKNWGKYNFNKGGKPVLDCVRSELRHIKDIELIPYVADNIHNEPIKQIYDTWYDSLTNRGTTRGQEEEKEEEQEEEGEKEAATPSSPLPSVIDNSFLKIKQHFEQQVIFQQCNYKQAQELGNILDDYLDSDLIIEAMKTAVLRGVPRLNYINGILRGWQSDGITTITQLQAKEAKSNAGNQQPNATYSGRSPEEISILKQLRNYSSTPST